MDNNLILRFEDICDMIEFALEDLEESPAEWNKVIQRTMTYWHLALMHVDDDESVEEYLRVMEYHLKSVMLSDRFSRETRDLLWTDIQHNAWKEYGRKLREGMVGIIARLMPKLEHVDDRIMAIEILVDEAVAHGNASIIPIILTVKDTQPEGVTSGLYYIITESTDKTLKRISRKVLHHLTKDANQVVAQRAVQYVARLNARKIQERSRLGRPL